MRHPCEPLFWYGAFPEVKRDPVRFSRDYALARKIHPSVSCAMIDSAGHYRAPLPLGNRSARCARRRSVCVDGPGNMLAHERA